VVSLSRRPCAPSDGPTSANQNSNPNLTTTTVRRDGAAPPSPLPPPLVAAGPAPGRGSRGGEFSYSIRKLDLSSSDSCDAPSGRIEPSRRRGGVPPGGSARALWPVGDVRHQDHRGRDVCMRPSPLPSAAAPTSRSATAASSSWTPVAAEARRRRGCMGVGAPPKAAVRAHRWTRHDAWRLPIGERGYFDDVWQELLSQV
jgi:hypothetical protein